MYQLLTDYVPVSVQCTLYLRLATYTYKKQSNKHYPIFVRITAKMKTNACMEFERRKRKKKATSFAPTLIDNYQVNNKIPLGSVHCVHLVWWVAKHSSYLFIFLNLSLSTESDEPISLLFFVCFRIARYFLFRNC